MAKFAVAALAALLLMVPSAYAQMMGQPGQAGTNALAEGGSGPLQSAMGRITSIDLAEGTLTLDNGTQLRLPQSFQFTSFPVVGQETEVTYVEQGGQKVVRSIDVGSPDKSNE
ncbi:MAG TPA: DUF1344 domain-containing protein [Candidatus Methylomirabilis sp.]|nr:DUF1344 domain-containing protein [Candidatus Methylomirabilis sp.]